MICVACQKEIQDGSAFCSFCGKPQNDIKKSRSTKKRGNGQGTVYKRGNKYFAIKTIGYYIGEDGKRHRQTVSKAFSKKTDAIAALPYLMPKEKKKILARKSVKFKEVYDAWLPTCTAGKSTINCYKAAFKHFAPLWYVMASDVDIDDLQECMDDCGLGKRTHENMKTVIGLVYKFGIPRGYFPEKLNLSDYLLTGGERGQGGVGFPDDYLKKIMGAVETTPGADLIAAQCYLGFRPSEFLSLTHDDYNAQEKAFIGGAKTDAGKNRCVTVSPKIQTIVDRYAEKNGKSFFCGADGEAICIKDYRELFYGVLDALGLENPVSVVADKKRHKYTPHSCRHTFATLMKRVNANTKDKLELIGHTSEEMLRHYQDVPLDDLRRITDQI